MRILVFQHLAVEHPGIFRDFWAEAGHQWDTVELDAGEQIPAFDTYDLLTVMGGPMDVWQEEQLPWLVTEKAAIKHWVRELGRPYLGICLGHQLLAEALGGKVTLMTRPEVGLADVTVTASGAHDPLFDGFGSQFETFQWHGAEVSTLPEGMEILAANAACPVQAMRWGRHAYGIQYHVEITPDTVRDWEAIPEYKASLEQALGVEQAASLGTVVLPRIPYFNGAARLVHDNLSLLMTQGRPE